MTGWIFFFLVAFSRSFLTNYLTICILGTIADQEDASKNLNTIYIYMYTVKNIYNVYIYIYFCCWIYIFVATVQRVQSLLVVFSLAELGGNERGCLAIQGSMKTSSWGFGTFLRKAVGKSLT